MTPRLSRGLAVAATLPLSTMLALGPALPASAAVSVIGNTVYGDGNPDNIVVTCLGGNLSAAALPGGDPCATLKQLYVYPEDGDDFVDLSAVSPGSFPVLAQTYVDTRRTLFPYDTDTVVGSPHNDSIFGDANDNLSGNAGDDLLFGGAHASGGLGDDTIVEFGGASVASGGPGDDRFMQFLPLGGIDGGTGKDSLEIDFDRAGKGYGEELLLRPGVDTVFVQIGPSSATMVVSGIETIDLVLVARDLQTYDGSGYPGISRIRGMGGVDVIIGGPQADLLDGGWGNDSLTGGAGSDDLVGGEGDDSIAARDGVADRIDCGAGSDTVVADAVDSVVGCENVQLPPVVTPPPPAPVVPATGKVKGPSSVEKGKVATFKLKSPTAGATFQCKLDKGAWKACKPTHKVKTAKLKLGKHKLQVRAVLAGVVDPTPSVKRFSVTS